MGKGIEVSSNNGSGSGGSSSFADLTGDAEDNASLVAYVEEQIDARELVSETLKHLSANQTTTANSLQNITDLVFAATASTKYRIEGFYRIGCSDTGGVKFGVTLPSGATIFLATFGFTTSSTVYGTSVTIASATATSSALCTVASANGWAKITGTITIGLTAGDVQFSFQSTTNGQTSTIFSEGSYMSLTPMS